jgi:ubiquinone/menaquinone biosynthesis C-methylase UbiE/uncharacterized protein YbaR (Trm112 family)
LRCAGADLFPNDLLKILVCPSCGSELQLEFFSRERKDGIFFCKGSHWYPIDGGLPRLMIGQLRGDYSTFAKLYERQLLEKRFVLDRRTPERSESKQVQDTFYEKWTSKDTVGIADSSPYKSFMRSWMLEKYGWGDETRFKQLMNDRRLILDVGTGLGREVVNFAKAAKDSTVVGIEFSDCAVNALKNVSGLRNTHIIQADLLRMPFKEGSFDFILCEGVLHHTPDPEEALGKCCRALKNEGEIAFYVYRKKGPAREFTDDYLREIVQKESTEKKWDFADRMTRLGKALADLRTEIEIPVDIPEMGITEGKTDIHRFFYWNFLKCFWNDKLPFDENRLANFDWFAPKHAHRVTEEEVRDWCRKNHIDIIWFKKEESGYSVRGTKRS